MAHHGRYELRRGAEPRRCQALRLLTGVKVTYSAREARQKIFGTSRDGQSNSTSAAPRLRVNHLVLETAQMRPILGLLNLGPLARASPARATDL